MIVKANLIFLIPIVMVLLLLYFDHRLETRPKKKTKPLFKYGEFGYSNKYDAYVKCIKIINSCKTLQQWNRVGVLGFIYDDLYDDEKLKCGILDVWYNFEINQEDGKD